MQTSTSYSTFSLTLAPQDFSHQSEHGYVLLVDEANIEQTIQQLNITQDWLKISQFKAKLNENQWLISQSPKHPSLFLLGLGNHEKLEQRNLPQLAQTIIKTFKDNAEQIIIDFSQLPAKLHYHFALTLTQASYQFGEFKSEKKTPKLTSITLLHSQLTQEQLGLLSAIQQGQNFTRDLGNRPGNICFPEYLAQQALALAEKYPDLLKVTVLDEDDLEELGMNAFLAVSRGSKRPGRVVLLEYAPQREEQPIVLVGKGVTFDTGGISIKPAANMDEMKFDMCGAASVLGVIRALCESKLPIKVVGALACAENMPSGKATRPGDIVTSMSGKTVEILNTDAEGRLVLCDTLTYVQRYNPKLIIDIATLTGACVVALGKVYTGLFSEDVELIGELRSAGEQVFDRVWPMPVSEDYQELLDSTIADMGNIGGPYGGSITAACFLKRFTEGYRWAHLDIAGTAWLSGAQKGATGRPVPLLMQFLINQANS